MLSGLMKGKKIQAYTPEEVANNNSEKSLWLIINRKVYDVTKFHKQHPGGAAVMLQMAGKDATAAAAAAHKTSLPGNLMKEFIIGTVKKGGAEATDAVDAAAEGGTDLVGSKTGSAAGSKAGSAAGSKQGSAAGSAAAEEAPVEDVEEAADAGEGEEGEAVDGEEGDQAEVEVAEGAETVAEAEDSGVVGGTSGADVNTSSFEELHIDPGKIRGALEAWQCFISSAESREAAGEAIYVALFEGAPSLQSLFTTPRAVQAMRFMAGLNQFVSSLDNPPQLKIAVETLGFGHLNLDVTVPRVVIFRDAILDLFEVELGERFTSAGRGGWLALLNYVGGAIIYIKTNYAGRLKVLASSWKVCTESGDGDGKADDSQASAEAAQMAALTQKKDTTAKKGGWFGGKGAKEVVQGTTGVEVEGTGDKRKGGTDQSVNIPTTYNEMFLFNSAVMGFGKATWMNEVLDCFDTIVRNVANSGRLQQECDILVLRISRCSTKGSVSLPEYKSCMLASLRSLLAKDWDSEHEVAWSWLWENVERLLNKDMGKPPLWEKAVIKLVGSLDEVTKYALRADIYARFFSSCPAGQDFFKQSTTYLHVIADKVIDMVVDIFKDPVKMVDDISALGLRHVGYAIPTEHFGPFVTACVEVVQSATSDETTVEAFRWSLGLISKMLVRTITEGSTIVMKAINSNSQKAMRKAISCAPRGERAMWMLKVQVGSQSISPLEWSLSSGMFQAAQAIIADLLIFRADRDKYYYGASDLFARHPDIVKNLVDNAPVLMPTLLSGLIWRSRTTESGQRRVNYYLKNLLINEDGNFDKAIEWIARAKDPKLVCHPMCVTLSDLVWSGLASRRFLFGKSWFLFNLVLFLTAQSVIHHLHEGENYFEERVVIFSCRAFIYLFSMTQLLYVQLTKLWVSIKARDFIQIYCLKIPKHLETWQDSSSVCLMMALIGMLCLEPMLWCWGGDKMFDEDCSEAEDKVFAYSIFSMFAMFLYYGLLVDIAVFSMRVSAFVLVCGRMLEELGLFVLALAGCLLTFSASISALKHNSSDFKGIPVGVLALFKIVIRMFSAEHIYKFKKDPVVFFAVCVYIVATLVFLCNLLIAQLTCAYNSIYEDMVGFARLKRMRIVVDTMSMVSKNRWERFSQGLRLDKRIEFNEGDIGLKGGIQLREPSGMNPTTVDMIRRFGGSTNPENQWPEEDMASGGGDEEDRFERMEQLIQRAMKRIAKGNDGGGGGGKASSSGMGGSGMGSAVQSGSASGGSINDGED